MWCLHGWQEKAQVVQLRANTAVQSRVDFVKFFLKPDFRRVRKGEKVGQA